MSIYEIGLLGQVAKADRDTLAATIAELIADFDLKIDREVMIRCRHSFNKRDMHAATVVAYFGSAAQLDQELAGRAVAASLPVIPIIPNDGDFSMSIPAFLQGVNCFRRRHDDPEMRELAVGLLGCIGLLRGQRRVFISSRQAEARNAAVQLHDLLSARGFDVFLDTHDVWPAEPFSDVLWHRLCDSDVMVMLDTPNYFENKWTRQELGRARAKEIHVLRIVWPNHTPSKQIDLAETIYLDQAELGGSDGPVIDRTVEQIVLAIEDLRSRSIASRYMSIIGKLRVEVEKIGGEIGGVGAHRAISVRLPDATNFWAYPVVGVPTADQLNDIADKARRADQGGIPVLVYDHIGIRAEWMAHIKWLDDNIGSVRAIPVAEAAWALAAMEV